MALYNCLHCGAVVEFLGERRRPEAICDCGALLERDHADLLADRRHELMNDFGHGAFRDGLVRDRIAAIDARLAELRG